MRDETLALHAGFDADPATRAVAVPIYQTAAYQFDTADHGAALVQSGRGGLSLQPHRQPHGGGAGRTRRGAGRRRRRRWPPPAARRRCIMRSPMWRRLARTSSPRRSFTAPPIPCWRICCRARASKAAFAAGDSAEALAACMDENTRALFCETVGNPAGNICDIEAIARSGACPWRAADRGQYRGDADPAEARSIMAPTSSCIR